MFVLIKVVERQFYGRLSTKKSVSFVEAMNRDLSGRHFADTLSVIGKSNDNQ